jgi:NAD(P)-dependent dehydrogenase (short-subunit alcohol dehydrogenase family)
MDAKAALVTGGGRRLGRAIALTLADAGYDLLVGYRSAERSALETAGAARERGRRAHVFRADLARPGEAEALVAAAHGLLGRLDLLVNNAALFPDEPLGAVTESSWLETVRVNLIAPALLSRAAGPMLRERRGAIVNIGSLGGALPYRRHVIYSLTKAGLAHLTRVLAHEMAPQVRVNAVAPGSVLVDDGDAARLPPVDAIPMGRHATPADVASLVLLLAESAAYVTGQMIPVDGGRSLVA